MFKRLCVLFLVLFLVACSGGGSKKKASKSAAEWQVIQQREIEIEGGQILSLSPDGKWLAVEKGQMLCTYQVESLTEQACAQLESRSLDLHSVTWSPDSTKIAFTENFLVYFHESDLWLMEAETGELNNLTDDGVDRYQIGGEVMDKALIDLTPAWSPDGEMLLFVRSTRSGGDWQGTALYRIPTKGGDPEKVLSVTDEEPIIVRYGLSWTADGKNILYTRFGHEFIDPNNGIWMAEADGDNPERLLGITKQEMGPPFLLEVSAQGDKALIWYYAVALSFSSEPNISYFALLDLETGRVEPLKQARGTEIEFFGVLNATLSPDGSKVLYIYKPAKDAYQLVARDLDGEAENVLWSFEQPLSPPSEFGLGLDWADDDTIFVVDGSGSGGLLVSLGVE